MRADKYSTWLQVGSARKGYEFAVLLLEVGWAFGEWTS